MEPLAQSSVSQSKLLYAVPHRGQIRQKSFLSSMPFGSAFRSLAGLRPYAPHGAHRMSELLLQLLGSVRESRRLATVSFPHDIHFSRAVSVDLLSEGVCGLVLRRRTRLGWWS
eukprot:2586768-Amphidinium_carterae.1